MPLPLIPESHAGERPELLIDQGHQPIERGAVALTRCNQKSRDLVGRWLVYHIMKRVLRPVPRMLSAGGQVDNKPHRSCLSGRGVDAAADGCADFVTATDGGIRGARRAWCAGSSPWI